MKKLYDIKKYAKIDKLKITNISNCEQNNQKINQYT